MTTLVIPHIDPTKQGATEHVDAILQALLKDLPPDMRVAQPVESRYEEKNGKKLPLDLTEQIEALKQQHPNATNYIVITGDYGADRALYDDNVAETFKRVLGEDTHIILSSYNADQETIVRALEKGSIRLAVPRHAVSKQALAGTAAASVLEQNQENLIITTGVPHSLTPKLLAKKNAEWKAAAIKKDVEPLPDPSTNKALVAIIIPGDIEDRNGQPVLFTEDAARNLANHVALAAASLAHKNSYRKGEQMEFVYMVSNSPRTGKYNPALRDDPDFNPNNPNFHNADRMNGTASNPVATAFVEQLGRIVGPSNIIDGCIAKSKVPPQGFLAFYDVLNRQVQAGGEAMVLIDGISATMMAQAADPNVLDPRVKIIACDSPAKNSTHEAGAADLFASGHLDRLKLLANQQSYALFHRRNGGGQAFDDAAIVASSIRELAQPSPTRAIRPSRGHHPIPHT